MIPTPISSLLLPHRATLLAHHILQNICAAGFRSWKLDVNTKTNLYITFDGEYFCYFFSHNSAIFFALSWPLTPSTLGPGVVSAPRSEGCDWDAIGHQVNPLAGASQPSPHLLRVPGSTGIILSPVNSAGIAPEKLTSLEGTSILRICGYVVKMISRFLGI
jgi:hypothetical protein